MARFVAPIVVGGENLSQEAEMVVAAAEAPLRKWMQESIETLQKDFSARVDEAAKSLEQEAGEIAGEHEKLQNDLAALVNQLNAIDLKLPAGADPKITADSKKAAADMKDYLAQREQKWKNAGTNAVKALMAAKTAVTGIP
jgi:hypothetical protein